jgi:predicted transcriptional regulator
LAIIALSFRFPVCHDSLCVATSNRKMTPIPVALDDELLNSIDRAAGELKQSRSALIRAAIRAGLAAIQASGSTDVFDAGNQIIVRKGGAADVLQLDGELSRDVSSVAERHHWQRGKVIIEAIRAGLPALPVGRALVYEGEQGQVYVCTIVFPAKSIPNSKATPTKIPKP